MILFDDVTAIVNDEFFTAVFDGDLNKLVSEVKHTGVCCRKASDTETCISMSGSWDALQTAHGLLDTKYILFDTSTETFAEEEEVCLSSVMKTESEVCDSQTVKSLEQCDVENLVEELVTKQRCSKRKRKKRTYVDEDDSEPNTRTSSRKRKPKAFDRSHDFLSVRDLDQILTAIQRNKDGEFFCPKCNYTGYRKTQIREHLLRHHMERLWECKVCSKCFGLKKDLVSHELLHAPADVQVTCSICKREYSNEERLRKHMAFHQLKERRKLKENDKTLLRAEENSTEMSDKQESVLPLELHVPTETYPCSYCGEVFTEKKLWRNHINMKHDNPTRRSQCPFCEKKFINNRNWKQHVASHLGKPLIPCEICGKTFISRSIMNAHKVIHKPKNFVCPVCSKGFVSQARLKEHLTFHSDARNYVCSTCGKSFPTKSSLVAHERTHNDARPYGCPHCQMRFKMHYYCKRHMVSCHGYEKEDYEMIHQNMLFLSDSTHSTNSKGNETSDTAKSNTITDSYNHEAQPTINEIYVSPMSSRSVSIEVNEPNGQNYILRLLPEHQQTTSAGTSIETFVSLEGLKTYNPTSTPILEQHERNLAECADYSPPSMKTIRLREHEANSSSSALNTADVMPVSTVEQQDEPLTLTILNVKGSNPHIQLTPEKM